jgi:nitric oxide reductase large subunit
VQPTPPQKVENTTSSSEHSAGKFVFALLALVLVMIFSVYYKGPSGQSFDTEGFILFWLRELILLGFIVIAFVIVGIGQLRRSIQRNKNGNDHAP